MRIDRRLGVVVALAVGVRLAAQIALGTFTAPEAWEYDEIARNLLSGNGFTVLHNGTEWHAGSAPLYPLLLTAIYAVFGPSPVLAALLNLVLGAVLVAIAYRIALALMDRNAATVAAGLVGLHPGLVVYAAKIHALNLDVVVVAATALALVTLGASPTARAWAVTGVISGIAALTRATVLPAIAIVCAAAIARHGPAPVIWRRAMVAAGIAIAIALPWVIRNAVVMHSPSLQPRYGDVLWRGNTPSATGGAYSADGRPLLESVPDVRDLVWGKDEFTQNQIFSDLAVAYIREDPLRAGRDLVMKLGTFWWFGREEGLLYPRSWLIAYELGYVILVAGAALGAAQLSRQRRRWPLFVFVTLFVVVSVIQSAFYVEGRHRWELEPLLVILATLGAASIVRWFANRSARPYLRS